jgi:hypothetical protein
LYPRFERFLLRRARAAWVIHIHGSAVTIQKRAETRPELMQPPAAAAHPGATPERNTSGYSTDNSRMTYLVIVAFLAIIGSLAAALVFMMRGGAQTDADDGAPRKNPMARALAFRVGFSILLFVAVLISYRMGWIHPTGLPLQR